MLGKMQSEAAGRAGEPSGQGEEAPPEIFTCFNERVTPRMRDAAASTGRFMETPTVQIYTVEDYFEGRIPALPRVA